MTKNGAVDGAGATARPAARTGIEGVRLLPLERHADERGSLAEIYRCEWLEEPVPLQWNVVWSEPHVLRGVHLHLRHNDYLVAAGGRMWVGLSDLRRSSRTHGSAELVELRGDAPGALVIPPGVAHGFYFPERAIHVYGVDCYFDPADELGCRWDDPELGIPWPEIAPRLSPRDAQAGSLGELMRRVDAPASAGRSSGAEG